jgi:hypothetical protein
MSIYANPSGDSKEGIDAYTRGLLDLVGDRDPLSLLSDQPERLAEAVRGLTDAQVRQREAPGKWSIGHVLQHLADSELVSSFRLRMIVAHDTPPIPAYDQDRWASRLHYDEASSSESLELFRVLRQANLRLLRALNEEERQRGGLHSERGLEDVNRLMRLIAGHDIVHLRQVERIRSAASGD